MTKIHNKTVLCFKSELHLNQDGIRSTVKPGTSTLPVKDMFHQIIDEAEPSVVLTVGTAGGVFAEQDLGDVVVTRAAKFRLQDEFKNEPFNNKVYESDWKIPTTHFSDATKLMESFKDAIQEPAGVSASHGELYHAGGRISQAGEALPPGYLAGWAGRQSQEKDTEVSSHSHHRLL